MRFSSERLFFIDQKDPVLGDFIFTRLKVSRLLPWVGDLKGHQARNAPASALRRKVRRT